MNPTSISSLGESDQEKLHGVRVALVDHLMHRDALREFTAEQLEQRLAENVGTEQRPPHRRHTLREVAYIMALVFLSFGAGFLATAALPLRQRLLAGPMFAIATLYLGIAWLSWSGLGGFSPRLRRAYAWICIGYLVTGLGVMTAPLPLVFTDTAVFRYGMIMPIFVPASILIYLGTRIFAQALSVKSWAASARVAAGLAILTGILVMLLPHPTQEPSDLYFRVFLTSTLVNALLASMCSLLAYLISRRTTAMYAKAMRWFSVTMASLAAPLLGYGALVYFGGAVAGLAFVVMVSFFSIPGTLMLVSAYMLKRSGGNA